MHRPIRTRRSCSHRELNDSVVAGAEVEGAVENWESKL